ncbi:MAG: cytochrome ubiquinol oxidase subunit I [Thermoguttaceae bacterium]|jgi:mono/diheme cytochrome c family protein
MHYPWWYVPHLTAPMLIATISVLHVLVSHYAVGGGLFLAVEITYAYRHDHRDYLDYLRTHARFFVLLTLVLGAVTGAGIWWTIGLASPLATGVLITSFVFGWATEYVFFLVEIVSAFVFYYYWGRLPQRTHVIVVWIYAIAAWASLVIITAITAFMLQRGNWKGPHDFWNGVCNPQTLPQIIARTGGALLLSSLYVYLHAAITIKDTTLLKRIESRSARPALLGAILILAGGAGWYWMLPDSARAALGAASALNVLTALIFAVTTAVFILLYLGPYRNPGWIRSPGFALSLLLFGTVAFSSGEFIREAVRKPYVIYNVVLANQILPEEVAGLRQRGFLEGGTWTRAFVAAKYRTNAQLVVNGHIDPAGFATLPPADRIALGGLIFQYHCNDCHAVEVGYSAVGPLVQGWTPPMIRSLIDDMHVVRFTMPPWSGTPQEADLLVEYLVSIAPKRPGGMLPKMADRQMADRQTADRQTADSQMADNRAR